MKKKYFCTPVFLFFFLLLVRVQPALGTIHIPGDTTIGDWDSVNRIYTLAMDVNEAMQIDENDLILDGNGYTVTGGGSGIGIYLNEKTLVTIKNLNIQNFSTGIRLDSSSSNVIEDITASSNSDFGIMISSSSNNNTIASSTASNNGKHGIYVSYSSFNDLTNSSTDDNAQYGIILHHSPSNIITGNTSTNNTWGIHLYYSSSSTLMSNNVKNNGLGIYLFSSSASRLAANTVTYNSGLGIYLYSSSNTILTDNTTENNNDGIRIRDSDSNTLTDNISSNNKYYGIYFYAPGSSDNNLIGNTACNNGTTGIYLHSNSSNNTLNGNTACNNIDYGIWLGSGSDNSVRDNSTNGNRIGFLVSGSYSTLENNIISDNILYGILMGGSFVTFTGNSINSNDWGVYMTTTTSNDNTFSGNTFSDNNRGVVFYGSTSGNTFYNNYFNNTENYYHIYSAAAASWNTTKTAGNNIMGGPYLGGNFWANPDGTGFSETCDDLDYDGICDMSYTMTPGEVDYLPLSLVSPPQLIDGILAFFDESIGEGTLEGRGQSSALANLRLWVMRMLLEFAKDFIGQDMTQAACFILERAYNRTDGEPNPPDLVTGEAKSELALMIQGLRSILCEP